MDARLDFIFSRRSIRAFRDEVVPEEAERSIIEAAMSAPSACQKDPWSFIVVRSKETLNAMADALPNGQMLRSAPMGILVCGDLAKAHGGELSYLLQDCSAAIENMLLAANALKLGACWLGAHPREDRIEAMKKLFALPDSVIPVSAIAIGFPAEAKLPRSRFSDTAVHHEKWQTRPKA